MNYFAYHGKEEIKEYKAYVKGANLVTPIIYIE